MTEWLVRVLELQDRIPEGAEVRFEWGHLPRGEAGLLLVLGALAAAALTIWLYRREGRAGALRKGFLALLRLSALALLAAVLLEPRLAIDLSREVPGRTVVLWDTSLSMSLADRYAEEERRAALAAAAQLTDPLEASTRHELAWRIVERAGLLEALAAKNQLVVYGFAEEARPHGAAPDPSALAPSGAATDLAGAVRTALADAGTARLAAVIAITDGRLTRGEGAQGVIAALEGRDVPFYALGIGDPVPPINLEVVELEAEPRALLGDPLVVEATVRAQGFAGRTSEAVLTVRRQAPGAEPGPAQEVETRTVRFEGDGAPVRLSFRHEAKELGDYLFELRLPPAGDEPVTDDNAREVAVKVTDDQARVLLVAGGPCFEYHFLRTRLTREKGAILSAWLQSADPRYPQGGNERLEALPRTLEALREFDAVILLDPDPEGFDGALADALKRFVQDHQGGLLYVPGPKHAATFLTRAELEPLRALLPVIPAADFGDAGRRGATESWALKATPDGALHPATRLASDPERCARVWSRLPGFYYSLPVQRVKHGAAVLVRHQVATDAQARDGRPLLVAHFFQGGPVVFQGSDETWRWRSVARRAYDRYWVGLLRFLVQGRLAGGRKRVELLADRRVYALGEPIRLRAHAYDASYRPLEAARLEGRARVGAEERDVVFEPSAGRPGWFEATLLPPALGALEIALRLPDDDPGAPPETLELTVRRADRELAEPQLDEATLRAIADGTGGALVPPGELGALAERIPSRREQVVVAGAPIELWDRWATLLAVCALLGLEWALRKRSRMV